MKRAVRAVQGPDLAFGVNSKTVFGFEESKGFCLGTGPCRSAPVNGRLGAACTASLLRWNPTVAHIAFLQLGGQEEAA